MNPIGWSQVSRHERARQSFSYFKQHALHRDKDVVTLSGCIVSLAGDGVQTRRCMTEAGQLESSSISELTKVKS